MIFWMSRRASGSGSSGGGIFSMGRSRAKLFNKETDIKVKFGDVAGMGRGEGGNYGVRAIFEGTRSL